MKIITEEHIREQLAALHKAEDKYNKRMTQINWEIGILEKEKKKLAGKVSNNMRHRNILINKLPPVIPNSDQNAQECDASKAK